MGMMGRILGMGGAAKSVSEAVTGVAEVFVGNRAERDAAEHAQLAGAMAQHGAEFGHGGGRFDGFVNGLNRLPRPMLAIGTLGLFCYAMADPAGFSVRMQGLALAPEPLWWLLGAIVSFYFGARELHYRRVAVPVPRAQLAETARQADDAGAPAPFLGFGRREAVLTPAAATAPKARPTAVAAAPVRAGDPTFNAAVEDWRSLRA